MPIDLAKILPQIDQLAQAIDDTTAAELEASLEHALTVDWFHPGVRVNAEETDYHEGFLAGMVWAIVLARRGAPTIAKLLGIHGSTGLLVAANTWERSYKGDDLEGVAHSLRCLAQLIDDGYYPEVG